MADLLRSGDEESDSPLLDARTATQMGSARIEKRSHGSKRPELRACTQRAECGSESFVDKMIDILTQLGNSIL